MDMAALSGDADGFTVGDAVCAALVCVVRD